MDYDILLQNIGEILEIESATSVDSWNLSRYNDLVHRCSRLYTLDDLCSLYREIKEQTKVEVHEKRKEHREIRKKRIKSLFQKSNNRAVDEYRKKLLPQLLTELARSCSDSAYRQIESVVAYVLKEE